MALNLNAGVTLTLDSAIVGAAYDLSGTQSAGLTGTGTLDAAGNTDTAVLGDAAKDPFIGNVGSTDPSPDSLTIVGWKYGVVIASTATEAATDIVVENLQISGPAAIDVIYPFWITSRPALNGPQVEGLVVTNLLVDGGQPLGVNGAIIGSEWSAENGFTADQITLQGVSNAVLTNVTSVNGGENAVAVAWGSTNVTFVDAIVSGADCLTSALMGPNSGIC